MAGSPRAEPRRTVWLIAGRGGLIKIFTKEDWVPPFADRPLFVLALAMATVLLTFAVIPVAPGVSVADLNVGLLFFFGVSSLGAFKKQADPKGLLNPGRVTGHALMGMMWLELIAAMPLGMGPMMRAMGEVPAALELMKPLFPLLFAGCCPR